MFTSGSLNQLNDIVRPGMPGASALSTSCSGDSGQAIPRRNSGEPLPIAKPQIGYSRTVNSDAALDGRGFDIGDRVITLCPIGLLRPRVPRGATGIIAARSPTLELEVHFDNGRVELVQSHTLASY